MRRGGAGSGGSSAVVRESGPVGNREQVVGESECRVNWQLIFKNLIDERMICSKMKFTVKTGWANACAKVVDNESERLIPLHVHHSCLLVTEGWLRDAGSGLSCDIQSFLSLCRERRLFEDVEVC